MNLRAADLTSFVGRRHEIEQAVALLGDNRMVTLVGPGGAGKTRLALRVAAAVSSSFPDGVYMVALDEVPDPNFVVHAIADELGLRDVSGDPIHSVLAHLREKTALLLLDNCEHVVGACGMFVGKVLAEAPGVRVLATSRHVLGGEGERLLPVRPLSVPRLRDGVQTGEGDAVELFVDRAAAATSGFRLTEENHETVVRICEQLDGMPLAIELAAAWLRVLSLPELLGRLDDKFGLLSRGVASKHYRQRTLRGTVEWSYELCSPEEQALWARLSVFNGGFTLADAEAVCPGGVIQAEDVLMIMMGLVEKSVVSREGHHGSARYRLLEMISQYGRDKLVESGQAEEFRARHCRYFHDAVEAIAEDWYGPRQQEHIKWLRCEHPNIRAALEFGLGSANARLDGALLATRLHFFWVNCGFVGEGMRWLDRVLAVDDLPDEVRADALRVSAYGAAVLGDHDVALMMARRGVALALRIGDPELLMMALYSEGTASLVAARYEHADACFGESSALFHRIENPGRRVVPPHAARGVLAALSGDWGKAEQFAERALAYLSKCGKCWESGLAHYALSLAKLQQNDRAAAFEHAVRCLRIAVDFEDVPLFAVQAEMLASTAASDGEAARAASILGLVERIWLQVGGSLLTGGAAWVEPHRALEAELRGSMGDKAFSAAVAVGTAEGTSLERAGRFLLRRYDREEEATGPLTKREMGVAVELARGATNKEIAAALSISPRTVEAHVDRILRKLGFCSRVQVGIWVASRAPGRLSGPR
ncbi:non-specific serine/threonine protein kinase [Lentzea fradiae]|uniref:Non-specific serine/threonine protein kinase n=1 Tax=Lentzea fradiae TaxID=200378 RepID=A0A1G8CM48_9PSEU|nr:LuxR C-terminal-related transcriptional regulator [Lentzea fradiae]SDH46548.1 non-specific serine/threonine protein kinase [Lentzea fradiae]